MIYDTKWYDYYLLYAAIDRQHSLFDRNTIATIMLLDVSHFTATNPIVCNDFNRISRNATEKSAAYNNRSNFECKPFYGSAIEATTTASKMQSEKLINKM